MSMTAGNESVAPGTMARAIYDELNSAFGAETDPLDTDRKKVAAAIAIGVVGHIVAQADVTVGTDDDGLQRDPVTPFAATLGPTSAVVISGAVS